MFAPLLDETASSGALPIDTASAGATTPQTTQIPRPAARRMPLLPLLTVRRWLDLCRHIGATSTSRVTTA